MSLATVTSTSPDMVTLHDGATVEVPVARGPAGVTLNVDDLVWVERAGRAFYVTAVFG